MLPEKNLFKPVHDQIRSSVIVLYTYHLYIYIYSSADRKIFEKMWSRMSDAAA